MPKGQFVRSEEHKRHIAEALRGKPKSAEHTAKMVASKKGQWTDAQQEAYRKTRENRTFSGWKLSEEHKRKLSEAKKGKSTKLIRHGVTPEEYTQQIADGNVWCYPGKHFVPKNMLHGKKVCTRCSRDFEWVNQLKGKYGVTPEWYKTKLDEQGGGCALCGYKFRPTDLKRLVVDHCHDTNIIRGILCSPCNTAIARATKVIGWGAKVDAYLAKYHSGNLPTIAIPIKQEKYVCTVCGLKTLGRFQRGRGKRELPRLPRLHRTPDRQLCPGNYIEAKVVAETTALQEVAPVLC